MGQAFSPKTDVTDSGLMITSQTQNINDDGDDDDDNTDSIKYMVD